MHKSALPDVVMEVDNTTDVRGGKLQLYEAWGFPEVWVEVSERASPSRPAGRMPRLTIHLLDAGSYRTVDVSRAFPGWTAAEIHTTMNETELSMATGWVLDRVGGGSVLGTAGPLTEPPGFASSATRHASRSLKRPCTAFWPRGGLPVRSGSTPGHWSA